MHAGDDSKERELMHVSEALDLDLPANRIREILHHPTPQEITDRREAVREHSTDAKRLLAAAGNRGILISGFPHLATMTADEINDFLKRTDVQIAEDFIAIHGSDALWQCRHKLKHLPPPIQMGRIDASRRFRSLARILRRMGGRAEQAPIAIPRGRRSVRAAGAS
jgi:hypothetical protein